MERALLVLRDDASEDLMAQVHHSLADLYLTQSNNERAIEHFLKAKVLLSTSS